MVSVLLFLLPTAAGVILALACVVVRRFLPRRLKIGWLASFVAAFGLGTGMAATALNARGLRLPMLEWLYGAKERHFREALQRKLEASSPQKETAGTSDAFAN